VTLPALSQQTKEWPSNRDQERNQSDEAKPPSALDNKREINQLATYNNLAAASTVNVKFAGGFCR